VAEFHKNLFHWCFGCTDECGSDATPTEGKSDAVEPVFISALVLSGEFEVTFHIKVVVKFLAPKKRSFSGNIDG